MQSIRRFPARRIPMMLGCRSAADFAHHGGQAEQAEQADAGRNAEKLRNESCIIAAYIDYGVPGAAYDRGQKTAKSAIARRDRQHSWTSMLP
jgi:hypothetical protein